MTVMHIHNCIW